MVSKSVRRAVAMLIVLPLLLTAANLLYTAYEVSSSNRQWCDTLTLLTSQPVPRPADPAANPSRMQTYTLYVDFVTLRRHLGC